DDGLPALEEEVADVHGRVEAAAAVAAQVDDEGGRALPPQRAHRLCDLLAGVLVEALERDVAHAVVEEDRERHGRDVDDGAGEAAADRLVHPRPYERDLDLGAGPAEQAAGHLLQLQAAGGVAVDLGDAVGRAPGGAPAGRRGRPWAGPTGSRGRRATSSGEYSAAYGSSSCSMSPRVAIS